MVADNLDIGSGEGSGKTAGRNLARIRLRPCWTTASRHGQSSDCRAAVKASRLVLSFEAATATLFSEVFAEPGGCAVIRRGCL